MSEQIANFIPELKKELGKVISGQQQLIDRLIIGLITGGHLLVEGVPGLAKTLTISSLSKAVNASTSRLQFTPDLLPADILGTSIYNPREHSFEIKKGPVFSNLILADEINRAPAKVQSALLEAMQEKQVSISGRTFPLPHPFMVMATQNPLEQEGTYPLPEAQMDRFMMKVEIAYPGRDEEREVLRRMSHPDLKIRINPVATLDDVLKAREEVDAVYLDEAIEDYVVDLVFATRPGMSGELSFRQKGIISELDKMNNLISCGASPRATLNLTLAAKAVAYMKGRNHVLPEDVAEIGCDVLRHRIIPSYEAEAEGINSSNLAEKILDLVQAP